MYNALPEVVNLTIEPTKMKSDEDKATNVYKAPTFCLIESSTDPSIFKQAKAFSVSHTLQTQQIATMCSQSNVKTSAVSVTTSCRVRCDHKAPVNQARMWCTYCNTTYDSDTHWTWCPHDPKSASKCNYSLSS